MRKKIYSVLESEHIGDKVNDLYDIIMIIAIVVSIVPLAFKGTYEVFKWIEYISVAVFIVDYLLRLLTADFKLGKGALSFLIYPFTPLAIIDLLSILPSLTVINNGLKLLRIFRLFRALRVLRAFKVLRYSKSFDMITNVFRKQKKVLLAVVLLAVFYVFISALIMFNVEPESFETFFDAVYWATISLTTVGYGDIYPITTVGKMVAMVSSIFGVAVVALPSGVITAGYLAEINLHKEDDEE